MLYLECLPWWHGACSHGTYSLVRDSYHIVTHKSKTDVEAYVKNKKCTVLSHLGGNLAHSRRLGKDPLRKWSPKQKRRGSLMGREADKELGTGCQEGKRGWRTHGSPLRAVGNGACGIW
jgi:hypothetical protein